MKINIFKELKNVFKAAKKEFILKFIISFLIRAILLIIPILFSEAVNLATDHNYEKAHLYVGISVAIIIIYRLIEGFNQKSFYLLYNKLYSFYSALGFSKTNENSMFSLSRFNLGQYSNMLSTDIDIIAGFYANLVYRIVQIFEFVIIYGYFLKLDKVLFFSALVVSIIVIFLIPVSNKKVEIINQKKKNEYDKMVMTIHQFFRNIKEIKCFNIFDEIKPITQNQTKSYLKENANYFVTYNWNIQLFLMAFEILRLVSVGYGIHLITIGHMQIGALLVIYNYYQKIIDNYSMILTLGVDFTNLKVSLERFNHLIEYSTPKLDKPSTTECITEGRIVFDNILYGYKNDPTLKDTTFEIEPNSITVITGKAGISKTGIFDLLLKLNRQHQGTITIDGYNIKDIHDDEYFSKITSLNKSPTFFEISIMDNLKLVEKDEQKILDICGKLDIHHEIINLKDGYDTIIQDNDVISSSLRQLIGVARTILKSSKIMLFDEALVSLDENKQNLILKLLLDLKKEHTIVLITHDKNILKVAEKILVVQHRTIVESGTLKELTNKKGAYYRLYEAPIES